MIRGATISVKHFLKKNIKPIAESSKNGEMVLKYPLYYYITIKRHTITRVSASGKYFSEEEFNNGERGGKAFKTIEDEKKIITDICKRYLNDIEKGKDIAKGINKLGKDFYRNTRKTEDDFLWFLNGYIQCYSSDIMEILTNKLKNEINDFVINKQKEIFDLSNIDISKIGIFETRSLTSTELAKFVLKNGDEHLFNMYYLYLSGNYLYMDITYMETEISSYMLRNDFTYDIWRKNIEWGEKGANKFLNDIEKLERKKDWSYTFVCDINKEKNINKEKMKEILLNDLKLSI